LDIHPEKYHDEDRFPEFYQFLREGKVRIHYSPAMRRYSIDVGNVLATQQIEYCPWSGSKFPICLNDKFWEVLETEYEFTTPTMDDIWEKRVPKEMQSEEWWIKRKF
jgi:Domain of unknown function (DUF6980)